MTIEKEEFNEKIDRLIYEVVLHPKYRGNAGLCYHLQRSASVFEIVFASIVYKELRKLPLYNLDGVMAKNGAWRFPIKYNSTREEWNKPRIEWLKSLKTKDND